LHLRPIRLAEPNRLRRSKKGRLKSRPCVLQ
jgi:hypothetical protein